MKHVLVKGQVDYADEFDLEFFGLYTTKEWNKLCNKVKDLFDNLDNVEICFGTNEYVTVENYDEWFDSFTVTPIEEEEFKFLKKTFGTEHFGTGAQSYLADITTILEELSEDRAGDTSDEDVIESEY